MNTSHLLRRPQPGYRFASAFVLGLTVVVFGAPSTGRFGAVVSAQALNPCTLLTVDEIEPLAGNTKVAEGVPNTFPDFGFAGCRYVWGVGVGHFTLEVTVNEASRMFPGTTPEQIKQRLQESVRAGTADAVISEIGDVAVFKPGSPADAVATALVKGRILQVHVGGIFAGERKDQVVALLKLAAARL